MTIDRGYSWTIGLMAGKISETIVAGGCPVEGLSAQGQSVMLVMVSELLKVVVASSF